MSTKSKAKKSPNIPPRVIGEIKGHGYSLLSLECRNPSEGRAVGYIEPFEAIELGKELIEWGEKNENLRCNG